MDRHLEAAVEAARAVGEYQRREFGSSVDHDYKSEFDPVSVVDYESEERILDRLQGAFPDHSVLSEERGIVGDGGSRWIVDPLDGTSNYVHGCPDFTVSIAFERAGELQLGVVYHPVHDDLYTAVRGEGAERNGSEMTVTGTSSPASALVGYPYSSDSVGGDELWERYRSLGRHVEGVRHSGSGALDLARTAAGILDGIVGIDQSRWDRAAGLLLVREAGATVTDLVGSPDYGADIVAACPSLHRELLSLVGTER